MRVLIVDDDPNLRLVLKYQITRAGHQVDEAADGQAAWELLQHEPIRLVITDWMMPNLSGPELIQLIRATDFHSYIYIIMLTAKEGKSDVIEGLEAGADDYLKKPFDAGELMARIKIGERILGLETRLQELATHDPLTSLLNRRALYHHAEAELNRSRRDGTPMSLVLLDVDHFKTVNDRFGHLIGDQALKLVADILTNHRRPYDWVGRWGGEEFVVVLPNTTQAEAHLVAERMREGVAAATLPIPDGQQLEMRASLGVTSIRLTTAPFASLDILVQQADEALYRAKRAGRNCVCVFWPDEAPAAE
jgi:two-component system chemotaxis response regulator CheY